MDAARGAWDSTFIPGTSVLANKVGIESAAALALIEYEWTADQERRIATGEIAIERTYDATYLRTIHKELFSALYEWAGEPRTYPMSKAGIGFAQPSTIGAYLDRAHEHISATNWAGLDRSAFAVEAATVYAALNTAHPFREGNGRASKIFMTQLARDAGYKLDYEKVTPEQWNNASMYAMPDLGAFEPVPDTLVPIFAHIATPLPIPEQETAASQAVRIASRGTSGKFPASEKPSTSSPGRPGRRDIGREHNVRQVTSREL